MVLAEPNVGAPNAFHDLETETMKRLHFWLLPVLVLFAALLPETRLAWPLGLLGLAGATTSTTHLDAALKIIFSDALVNNVVTDTELLNYFPNGRGIKRDKTTGGRYIETAQMFALPAGVGFRDEGDYIPVPSGPTIANSRIGLKKCLGAVESNAEVLKRVRTDVGAYVAWGREVLPNLVERVKNEIDRVSLGYGAGVKARVNDATPATDLIVDSAMGIAGFDAEDSLYHFLAGETLKAGPNLDGTSQRTGVMTVEDVDFASGHIVVDALATSLADNDYIFPGDAAGHSAGKEAMGLFGAVDDGGVLATFQNIARATYSAWKGHVIDAQASPFSANQKLTEKVIMHADNVCFQRGGGTVDLFVTSRQGANQYWADLVGDRSFNDVRSYTGGKGMLGVQLGDRVIALKVARKMPKSVSFGLTLKTFKKWVLHEWQWDDQTGSIWHQVVDGTGRKDAYWAYGGLHYEVGNSDPQKNFRIENIYDDEAF